jgi:hypothetical protein
MCLFGSATLHPKAGSPVIDGYYDKCDPGWTKNKDEYKQTAVGKKFAATYTYKNADFNSLFFRGNAVPHPNSDNFKALDPMEGDGPTKVVNSRLFQSMERAFANGDRFQAIEYSANIRDQEQRRNGGCTTDKPEQWTHRRLHMITSPASLWVKVLAGGGSLDLVDLYTMPHDVSDMINGPDGQDVANDLTAQRWHQPGFSFANAPYDIRLQHAMEVIKHYSIMTDDMMVKLQQCPDTVTVTAQGRKSTTTDRGVAPSKRVLQAYLCAYGVPHESAIALHTQLSKSLLPLSYVSPVKTEGGLPGSATPGNMPNAVVTVTATKLDGVQPSSTSAGLTQLDHMLDAANTLNLTLAQRNENKSALQGMIAGLSATNSKTIVQYLKDTLPKVLELEERRMCAHEAQTAVLSSAISNLLARDRDTDESDSWSASAAAAAAVGNDDDIRTEMKALQAVFTNSFVSSLMSVATMVQSRKGSPYESFEQMMVEQFALMVNKAKRFPGGTARSSLQLACEVGGAVMKKQAPETRPDAEQFKLVDMAHHIQNYYKQFWKHENSGSKSAAPDSMGKYTQLQQLDNATAIRIGNASDSDSRGLASEVLEYRYGITRGADRKFLQECFSHLPTKARRQAMDKKGKSRHSQPPSSSASAPDSNNRRDRSNNTPTRGSWSAGSASNPIGLAPSGGGSGHKRKRPE